MAAVMRQAILFGASTGTFLMFYYTDVVNINAATIGAIFLIARVINAVVALLTGWLIDNTHSKYGKARPWLLWFAVPFGIVTLQFLQFRM